MFLEELAELPSWRSQPACLGNSFNYSHDCGMGKGCDPAWRHVGEVSHHLYP